MTNAYPRINVSGLLDIIIDAVIAIDERQRIIFYNSAAEQIFGYAPDEVMGQPLTLLIPPRYSDTHARHVRHFGDLSQTSRAMGARSSISGYRKNGVEFPAEAAICKLEQDGERIFVVILRDITERKRAEEELQERAAQIAIVNERNRLARDLHDAVTQTLFSASLLADVIPRIWEKNPSEARRQLQELRLLSRGALAEMRSLLLELRPTALLEAKTNDLFRQLAQAASSRARVNIDLRLCDENQTAALPADVKIGLYRIAQEALNNVAKHSGATRAWVWLDRHPVIAPVDGKSGVRLTIGDDGRGFDVDATTGNQLGLRIMKERADSINAILMIDSRAGEGTTVKATWNAEV